MNAGLAEAYERCRILHRTHGRSYYLATRLLPAWKRRHVHALYGFTRSADEIVDALDGTPPAVRAARLAAWGDALMAGLDGAPVADPLLPAVIHTISVFGLDRADFELFLRSMAMDLTVASYDSYNDVLGYMDGSAAVIGTMMLPLLGAADPAAAREPARQLGIAFQLTNFVRDVAEDLGRGRLYLPMEDLSRFGVSPACLRAAAASGTSPEPVRELIRYEVARAREHYALAEPGIAMLQPSSRACIRGAKALYAGILDEVARSGYNVFAARARVPLGRRWRLACGALVAEAVKR
ncbi:phytoene/squalene synthase family protein [Longispora albida]|uniref:phytoene/squalene synthase family protein n=1 Tax=Longispora albida TaxID=203523 RepID=UPI000477CB76|nr:phytoene/squalene synthase family protein [Longispora albida]